MSLRARNIKPGFWVNDEITQLEFQARLLFIGLWCFADREGRFEWRPQKMKLSLFPADKIDISKHLQALLDHNLIVKYTIEGSDFGWIPKFLEHQHPHPHEARSVIPEYNQCHVMSLQVTKCQADILNPDIRKEDTLIPIAASPEGLLAFPLTGKQGMYWVTAEKVKEWEETFPFLDLQQTLRECRQWNIDNPSKRKTRGGIERHISFWLSKANDSGRNRKSVSESKSGQKTIWQMTDAEIEQRERLERENENGNTKGNQGDS